MKFYFVIFIFLSVTFSYSQIPKLVNPYIVKLVTNSEMTNLFSNLNRKLLFDKTAMKSALKLADSLFNNRKYDIALLEYYRANFYLNGKENCFDDSLSAYIWGHIGLIYREKKDFFKSDSIFSLIPTDDARIFELENLILKDKLKQADYYLGYLSSFVKKDLSIYSDIIDSLNSKKNIKDLSKRKKTIYISSAFIPGTGFLYMKNYKMAFTSFFVDLPMAVFLGDRISHIIDNYKRQDFNSTKVYCADFTIFFFMVFKRYWLGSAKESLKYVEKMDRIRYIEEKNRILKKYGL